MGSEKCRKLPEVMCLVSVGSQLDLLGLIVSFFEPRGEKEVWWEILSFDAAAMERVDMTFRYPWGREERNC